MAMTLQKKSAQLPAPSVRPSIRSASHAQPFTLDQELTPFGKWVSEPIWVPPKDASKELGKSMCQQFGLFASRAASWDGLVSEHRSKFTQVREIELAKASIRLPQGRLFVSVTERAGFDQISDPIPNCVRTRLEEFLAGPGKLPGVKVYYLKPLCVEVDDNLIFTTHDELHAIISKIQQEVFAEYRRQYLRERPGKYAMRALDLAWSVPRRVLKHAFESKKRAIDAYQAKLEYNRRKIAFAAAQLHRSCRTDGCSFAEILSLTNPPGREDAIDQYAIENELSKAQRNRLLMASAVTLPWFMTVPLAIYYLTKISITISTPVVVCDPAFVAEMPSSNGVVLKIGHFDEVRGVTHVEI